MSKSTRGRRRSRPPRPPDSPAPELVDGPGIVDVALSESDRLAYIEHLRAQQDGKRSTREIRRAAERYEQNRDLQRALRWAGSVEKKILCRWTGSSWATLEQFARRYGVPIHGPRWSIPAVVHWFFRWLAKYGSAYSPARPADGAGRNGDESEWLERLREEQARIKRIERLALERSMVPIDQVRELMELFAGILRTAAEQMQREELDRAYEIYMEALGNCEAVLGRYFERWEGDHDDRGARDPSS